ncbi:MAG: hypothetical protein PVJ72_11470 [Gammaproteobacteria bacterium]
MNESQHNPRRPLIPVLVRLLLIMGVSACASIERQVFTEEYANMPVSPEKVRTLSDEDAVLSCRKVALLTAKGEQPEERMLNKLRKVAGKLGANSLLVLKSRRSTYKDVIEGLPEAAAAGALGINATTPPAQTVEAIAYYCGNMD